MSGFQDDLPELGDPVDAGTPRVLSGGELQRRAIGGSLWTAIHVAVSIPVAFLANAVVARFLGVSDYGYLAFLTMGFAMATQIANGGFSASLVQWGAAAEAGGEHRRTDELLRRSLGFHLIIELPMLVVAVFLLAGGEGPLVVGALVLSSVLSCMFGGSTLAVTIENRSAAAAKLAILANLVLQVAVVLVTVIFATPIAVLVARLLAAAAFVPAHLWLLAPERRRTVLQMRLPRSMPPGFWRFAGQSFLAGMVGALVFSRSEILLLNWLSTTEAVGLFALAFGLSYQLTAPVDAMLNPLLPAVAGLVSAHPHLAELAFLRATRFASLLSALITGVLLPSVYFAIPVIYGESFAPAAALLVPLAVISCFQSIGQPVTAFVYARQQGGLLLRSHAWALLVNLAIAIALIKPLGVWGAVIANAAGQLVTLILLVRHELKIQQIGLRSFLAAIRLWTVSCLTGVLAIGLLGLLASRVPPWLSILVAPALGAALLVAAARLARAGILAEDGTQLLDSVPRRLRLPFVLMVQLFSVDEARVPKKPTAAPRVNIKKKG